MSKIKIKNSEIIIEQDYTELITFLLLSFDNQIEGNTVNDFIIFLETKDFNEMTQTTKELLSYEEEEEEINRLKYNLRQYNKITKLHDYLVSLDDKEKKIL